MTWFREYVISGGKLGNDRRVVRRTVPAAGLPVDVTCFANVRQRFAGENQVDTQPGIASKAGGPVIPPAEGFFGLFELPKDI